MTEQERIEIVKAWLLSKGITLWADWDIQTTEGLQDAAEWFHKQSVAFTHFFSEHVSEFTD